MFKNRYASFAGQNTNHYQTMTLPQVRIIIIILKKRRFKRNLRLMYERLRLPLWHILIDICIRCNSSPLLLIYKKNVYVSEVEPYKSNGRKTRPNFVERSPYVKWLYLCVKKRLPSLSPCYFVSICFVRNKKKSLLNNYLATRIHLSFKINNAARKKIIIAKLLVI